MVFEHVLELLQGLPTPREVTGRTAKQSAVLIPALPAPACGLCTQVYPPLIHGVFLPVLGPMLSSAVRPRPIVDCSAMLARYFGYEGIRLSRKGAPVRGLSTAPSCLPGS